jgi:outer membrane protein assembly factor BamB
VALRFPTVLPESRWARRLTFAGAGVLLLAVLGGVAYLVWGKPEGDVSNPKVEFHAPAPKTTKPHVAPKLGEDWPIYGRTPQRTQHAPLSIHPPFKKVWVAGGKSKSLLEFAPILVHGRLYIVNNSARGSAFDARTGKRIWTRHLGTLAASSFGYWKGRLFFAPISGTKNRTARAGVVLVSLRAKNGKVLWRKPLPSAAESGPQVVGGILVLGDEAGNVYGLSPQTGRTLWRYKAGGAVKGGLAYDKGRVFFGDYSGNVTALRARDGKRVWQASTSGRAFGLSGQFYGTAAVAFGRVYIGNTDGKVYSFAESTGELAWRQSTGNYVYASAAVADVNGVGPTVFIGSYDANFYALDARTGAVRWRYHSPGRISGAASVVGNVVYFANLGNNSTAGLDVRTGKKVWGRRDGGYNPVISDGIRLYLVGYARLYALTPVKAAKKTPHQAAAKQKIKHHPKR